MANLVSITSGNLTSAATWGVADTTSLQLTVSSSTTITTSQLGLPGVTPGAIIVSGLVARFATVTATPSGTLTVQLYNLSTASATASVTINVSDLPSYAVNAGNGCGYFYFKFGSPVTLTAGQSYTMRMATSASNQIAAYYAAGSAQNWIRMFVTTTTQAPAAGDPLYIGGSYTGAGTNSTTTVTMNDTSGTTYAGVTISPKGVLTYGTSASTNYRLSLSASAALLGGGSLIIGSQASPIPASSTATLEFASNVGIIQEGVLSAYGDTSKATGVKLAADVSAGATASTITNASSGWKSGDKILVPSTSSTYTQFEVKTLNADASGTTITHNSYTSAHGGNSTTLIQADLANLTRNIQIFGTSAASPMWILLRGYDPTISLYGVELYNIGNSSLSVNGGLYTAITTGGTLDLQYCSFYNLTPISAAYGYSAQTAGPGTLFRVKYCTFLAFPFMQTSAYSGNYAATPDISYNIFCGHITANFNVTINDYRIGFNNNVVACGGHIGLIYSPSIPAGSTASPGNIDNNYIYSHATGCVTFNPSNAEKTIAITANNWRVWRSNNVGIYMTGIFSSDVGNSFKFVNLYSFGHTNIHIQPGNSLANVIFDSSFFWNSSYVFTCSNTYTGINHIKFVSCTFGKDYLGNNSTNNFVFEVVGFNRMNLVSFYNSIFQGSIVNLANGRGGLIDGPIGPVSLKHNGVTGSHVSWGGCFTLSTDSTIFNTSSPSLRITPVNGNNKSNTQLVRIPVKAGNTCAISVAVRKSATGDGAAYNGNPPRLMYRQNHSAGNTSETVGATVSVGTGTWQTLAYTTPAVNEDCVLEFYVDCDGTVGWVNVDDWSTSTYNDSKTTSYWGTMSPYIEADTRVNPTGSSLTYLL